MQKNENCPLCGKRVSNWEVAGGKVVVIDGKIVHRACIMDSDESLEIISKRVKNA